MAGNSDKAGEDVCMSYLSLMLVVHTCNIYTDQSQG